MEKDEWMWTWMDEGLSDRPSLLRASILKGSQMVCWERTEADTSDMAFSRASVAVVCVCIGLLLLVDVSAVQEPQERAENAGATTQEFYLRGNTVGAMTEGTPLTEDTTEASFDSFGTVDVNDYTPTANCRPKPCRP